MEECGDCNRKFRLPLLVEIVAIDELLELLKGTECDKTSALELY